MLPEKAIEIIEYTRAFNEKNSLLMSALDMAVELLKKEQMKREHEESEEYSEGWVDCFAEIMARPAYFQLKKAEDDPGIVRCKNCDMWGEDNIILEGKIKENIKPCAQWSGEGYTVFTNKNDFCSYGYWRAE